jgi:NAD(P)H-nitrite reductase large subunit
METAGVKINFGCRSGLCGADAVAILDGGDQLSPPDEDELATLRRLGLEGQARLACTCQVKGPVTIDVDPQGAGAQAAPQIAAPAAEDLAAKHGIGKVVIIGNGAAGLGAAEALRGASPSLEIAVVTDESHHFCNRMAIGRVIYGRTAMEGLFLLPDDWYVAKKIDVWRNTLAVSIDRQARSVRLGTGETLPYDRLILATGAKSASPNPGYASFANAYVLRSANDALEIRARIQRHGARKAVVLGGGVLGVEAADALQHLGLDVIILQRSARLMDRQLDEIGALRLTQYLEAIGVRVRTHAAVEEFIGDGVLREVRLADGERIKGDIFIASVGLAPNVELARACGLDVGRGVKVDDKMRSSDPAIFAIGDVAERLGAAGGLWPIAVAQARIAAAALLGGEESYRTPPLLLQLKCDGVDLRSYGDVEPREGDEVLCADQDQDVWWKLILRDGKLAGAVFVGPPRSARDFTKALKAGADLPVLYSVLGVKPVPA